MQEVERVNRDQLRDVLAETKGALPVTMAGYTVPDMRKTNNPFFGRVKKRSHLNGMINWIYQNSVNYQRVREDKEPDFVPMPRRWGQRLEKSPFVAHNDTLYLEVKVQRLLEYRYYVDGREATAEEVEQIESFLPKRKEGRRQELDKVQILRDYTLENIEQITLNGRTYVQE